MRGDSWQLIIRAPKGSARPSVADSDDLDLAGRRFDQVVARLEGRTDCVVKLVLVSYGGFVDHVDRSWEDGKVILEPLEPEDPMYDDE